MADNVHVVSRYIPWYSDEYRISSRAADRFRKSCFDMTPFEIRDELLKSVIDQDEACKKVAMMVYQHLHGHRFVGMLAGPTGSGKSFIADKLSDMFPGMIYIRDISNVTCDGWSGGKKVSSLFEGTVPFDEDLNRPSPIMFLDECDKMFAPKTSSARENVSEQVQGEFLTVIHGGTFRVKDEGSDGRYRVVNTGEMSFLFAGAFEKKADLIAAQDGGPVMGFGSKPVRSKSYSRELTMEDIHEAGCINELCGRIQRLVNLNPISEDTYVRILEDHDKGPVHDLEKEFGLRLEVTHERAEEIAHKAYSSGLGIRGIRNTLRAQIDDLMWEDLSARSLQIA